jgi:hypothetical protein
MHGDLKYLSLRVLVDKVRVHQFTGYVVGAILDSWQGIESGCNGLERNLAKLATPVTDGGPALESVSRISGQKIAAHLSIHWIGDRVGAKIPHPQVKDGRAKIRVTVRSKGVFESCNPLDKLGDQSALPAFEIGGKAVAGEWG